MPTPVKLSHVVFKTFQLNAMRDWYCAVLNARVVFERPGIACFITYDDEHHRLAFAQISGDAPTNVPLHPGVQHVGFTFSTAKEVLTQYCILRDRGIVPSVNVNHGPTLSMYYTDPDGNMAELLVDRFATGKEADDFMKSEAYRTNSFGIEFDPEDLVKKMAAGATEAQLLKYDEDRLNRNYAETIKDVKRKMGM